MTIPFNFFYSIFRSLNVLAFLLSGGHSVVILNVGGLVGYGGSALFFVCIKRNASEL